MKRTIIAIMVMLFVVRPMPPQPPIKFEQGATMDFPTTVVLDNFNRTDEGPPPSANWSKFHASWGYADELKVVSNRLALNTAGLNADYWNALTTDSPNSEGYITLVSFNGEFTFGIKLLLVGMAGDKVTLGSFYQLTIEHSVADGDTYTIIRNFHGDESILASDVATIAAGDAFGFTVVNTVYGSQLTYYRKPSGGSWAAVAAVTDPLFLPQESGYLAFEAEATNYADLKFDDFGGGSLVSTLYDPPSDLTATAIGPSTIDLTWVNHNDEGLAVEVERSAHGAETWAMIARLNVGTTYYRDSDLTTLTPYDYRVRGLHVLGYTNYSNTATATTLSNWRLELVTRPDGGADVSVLDLLPWLAKDGYIQGTPESGQSTLDEAITLHVGGATDDALATQVQALDQKVDDVVRSHKLVQPWGVWLRTRMATESKARQAFITAARRGQEARVFGIHARSHYLEEYAIGLTRIPAWETDAPRVVTGTGISILGGALDYSDLPGDLSARVRQLTAYYASPLSNSRHLNEFWFGVKSTRLGCDPTHFQSNWDMVNASWFGADTGVSGGDVVCTFATTPGMAQRVSMTITSAVGPALVADHIGEYIVLLRAKTTSTLVVNVTGGSGFAGQVRSNPRQMIANTDFALYSLGKVALPPVYLGEADPDYAHIVVQAEIVSGSGTLVMDRVILIPAWDGWVHMNLTTGILNSPNLYANGRANIYQRPDGVISGNQTQWQVLTGVIKAIELGFPEPEDWGLPIGDGRLIMAAQETGLSHTGDTVNLDLTVYPRYATLRGAA